MRRHSVWMAGFVLGLAVPAASWSASADPGAYDGYQRTSRYVAGWDGTRLAVDIYLPTRDGKPAAERLPVLFMQMRMELRRIATRAGDGRAPAPIRPFIEQGYALVAQDRRGEGASFGVQKGFVTRDDARDGAAVIEWAGVQPWSDGKVGALGCSNQGAYQLPVVAEHPRHLLAVAPECASPFFFDTMISPNGVSAFARGDAPPYAGGCDQDAPISVGEPVDEDKTGTLARAAAQQHRCNARFLGQYQSNMHRDTRNVFLGYAPGQVDSVVERAGAVRSAGVRIYQIGGWFDASPGGQLQAWQLFGGRIVIGPWIHCGSDDPGGGFPAAAANHAADELRWFNYVLKGIDDGIGRERPVRFYTLHAMPGREWHDVETWPLVDQQLTPLYLDAGPSGTVASRNDGRLAASAPEVAGQDDYRPDYGTALFDGHYSELRRFWDGDMNATDRRGMTFTLAPLPGDLQVTGHPLMHLWVSSTAGDEDFFAVLEDIDGDGRSTYVTDGKMRASRRRLATPPWGELGTPWHAQLSAEDEPLEPGRPVELVFDMTPTSWVFRAGHRVRLTVLNAGGPQFQVPASWDRSKPPTHTIYRGPDHASRLLLPLIPASSPSFAGVPSLRAGTLPGRAQP